MPRWSSEEHRQNWIASRRSDPTVRFWTKVARGGEGDCWLWTGRLNYAGYGWFTKAPSDAVVGFEKARDVLAHRYSWELHHGPIPEGGRILHRCDNPPCVNPAHLFLGTQADNNADMRAKGRADSWGWKNRKSERR